MRLAGRIRLAVGMAVLLGLAACNVSERSADGDVVGSAATVATPIGPEIVAFDHGLSDGWLDYGWAAELPPGGPARVELADWGGWILARPGLAMRNADVGVRLRLPHGVAPDRLLRISLGDGANEFPTVDATIVADGSAWVATVRSAAINPNGRPFDRVILQAARQMPPPTIAEIERVGLFPVSAPRLVATGTETANVLADCSAAGGHTISPYIYGVAFAASREGSGDSPWALGTTARRWGGNPTSRYNWQDGHAWNTAADWYWRNVSILPADAPAWVQFLEANAQHGVAAAVTVPMIGWVAKDTRSYSFPVAEFGEQEATDPDVPDAGNGINHDGDLIDPPSPEQTSIAASPAFVAAWVRAMGQTRGAPVQYILDNEPDLWNDTHRDVHPEPVTYDELLERTVLYGTAVREADPDALIAGPASWGWWGYFYSAADAAAGFDDHPDREAHGDQELLAWYLDQLRAHRERTGARVLDVLDVHYYPQAKGVYDPDGSGGGLDTGRLRVRSTRSLWDATYEDESWIGQEIRLLPRMQELIAAHDPTVGLSIGEYSFGGEYSQSGAVAQAEALGRFAQFGVHSAFYWTYPHADSAVATAFKAYRNYDGKGSHFLERYVPSTGTDDVSLFTSTDGSEVVAVLVNRSDTAIQRATATFTGCGDLRHVSAYQYNGAADALHPVAAMAAAPGVVSLDLPPWSVTTIRLSPKG